MIASVVIQHNIKSLDRKFDYIVPERLKSILRIGHKVLVPFGNINIEGFVLFIHNRFDKNLEYKEIHEIIESDFYLNEELLSLGENMRANLVCNLISCYQVMLPRALKARVKTNINRKYETYIALNRDVDYEQYIANFPRRKKEIELIYNLLDEEEILRKETNTSLNNLLKNEIIKVYQKEVNRKVGYLKEKENNFKLTNEQINAYEEITNEKTNNKFLLFGVTGSGKTEIYIKLIEKELQKNNTAILLVPEISLTPQIVARFKSEFYDDVAVLHSRLSEGEKYDEYRRIMKGEVRVVVGARSAVFAPLKNIGIIIIDECQSTSYQQDNTPKYNAIDIALWRSDYNKCKVVLGSATPLLEQYARAEKGVFKLITLNKRINNNLPKIEIIDMSIETKKRNFIISEKLDKKLKETISKGNQAIILLNRRGYSTYLSCSSCGYVHNCPSCDISLIYHKSSDNLSCHYCGYRTQFKSICPNCNEDAIKDMGLGTEKLEGILKEKYSSKVLRMDYDTTTKKGSHEKMIDDFKNHKYDILVGTQMISKGLNFPEVTLVGIINIDASLSIPDFRSSERVFELLTQTGGRSARYNLPGEVIIQTYNPDNYVFKYIKDNDFVSFYKYEMSIRQKLKYSPYFYMCLIKIISPVYETARDESNKIRKYLDKALSNTFIILGPSTASIFKLKNEYHFQIIIKYKKEENLIQLLNQINEVYLNNKIRLEINMNPLNLF